jgi:hypothetical protein
MKPPEYLFLIDKQYLLFEKLKVSVSRGRYRDGKEKVEKFDPIAKVTYDEKGNAKITAEKAYDELKVHVSSEMIASCRLSRAELYGFALEGARTL